MVSFRHGLEVFVTILILCVFSKGSNPSSNNQQLPPSGSTGGQAGGGTNASSSMMPPVPPPTGAEKERVGDYSHFNNKLTIADFDLLKVGLSFCV